MKKYIAIILTMLLLFTMTACKNDTKDADSNSTANQGDTVQEDSILESETETITELESESIKEPEEGVMETNQVYIEIGESTLTVDLEDNESAQALKELLLDGSLTISASNYGSFEKVCSLGTNLPRNDIQTTTQAGDICLYNGNQIVIFYGSNSWAYTKLGRISGKNAQELVAILSGEETEITLSLNQIID